MIVGSVGGFFPYFHWHHPLQNVFVWQEEPLHGLLAQWGAKGPRCAGKSWGRQGKGHLGDAAGSFSLRCCCHRQGCCALGDAGVLHDGPPKMAESSPRSPLWHRGWAAAGIARLLGPRLSTYLHSIPLQTPIPHQLALQCAAYEMEEIKLQYLKFGRARCNI